MRLLKLEAEIPQSALPRLRPKRAGRALVSALVVAALVRAFSGVSVSPSRLQFSAVSVGSVSEPQTIRLINRGTGEVRSAQFGFSGNAAEAFLVSRNGCDRLGAGESCEVVVEFHPREPGLQQARLVMDVGGEELTALLMGSGTKPESSPTPGLSPTPRLPPTPMLSPTPTLTPTPTPKLASLIYVEPKALEFSSRDEKSKTINVVNEGNAPLEIRSSLQGSDADRFAFRTSDCNAQVPAGSQCAIVVDYKPNIFMSKASYSARLEIQHNAANAGPESVTLSWTRETASRIRVTPNILTFTNYYQFAARADSRAVRGQQQEITIRNDGPGALQSVSLQLGFLGRGENGPFTHTRNCRQLQAGEECKEIIGFAPRDSKEYKETLFVSGEPSGSSATVELTAKLPGMP